MKVAIECTSKSKDDINEIDALLGNIFGVYFKNNLGYIVKKEVMIDIVIECKYNIWENFELGVKYAKLDNDAVGQLTRYIGKCCEIFWIIAL